MKKKELLKLVLTAMFAALAYVATTIIQIPIPATGGYINLGDCVVLLGAFLLGPIYGALAGGIGSALADILSGYAQYAIGTFVIKAAMAAIAALIYYALKSKIKISSPIAAIIGEIIMIAGYFIYESVFLGYGLGAAAAIPGNAIQAVAGAVSSVLLYHALYLVPQIKKISYQKV